VPAVATVAATLTATLVPAVLNMRRIQTLPKMVGAILAAEEKEGTLIMTKRGYTAVIVGGLKMIETTLESILH
jgi:hypothetical protein